jgi:hypothetical protein
MPKEMSSLAQAPNEAFVRRRSRGSGIAKAEFWQREAMHSRSAKRCIHAARSDAFTQREAMHSRSAKISFGMGSWMRNHHDVGVRLRLTPTYAAFAGVLG